MTKVWDDLEIWETDLKGNSGNVIGKLEFGTIVESRKDEGGEESFWIEIKKGISDDKMVPVLCHELEHYDVTSTLINLKLFTKADLSFHEGLDGILTRPVKEWFHSNPSYYPEAKKE